MREVIVITLVTITVVTPIILIIIIHILIFMKENFKVRKIEELVSVNLQLEVKVASSKVKITLDLFIRQSATI
ncbi:unnamed protein product [Trichobilharzia regenti]|nr:unnamed protein product [Trichobilharzia regenti]